MLGNGWFMSSVRVGGWRRVATDWLAAVPVAAEAAQQVVGAGQKTGPSIQAILQLRRLSTTRDEERGRAGGRARRVVPRTRMQ